MSRNGAGPLPPRTRTPPAPRQLDWFSVFTGHAATMLLWVGGITAAAFGLTRLTPQAEQFVAARTPHIEWIGLPLWLQNANQAGFLEQQAAQIGLGPGVNLVHPDLARAVAERLALSPWIAEVKRVNVVSDGRIDVEAAWREPLAMVERGGRAYLVDTGGVRLPLESAADQVDRQQWLVVRGLSEPVPQRAGEPWRGEDMQAALKMVKFLETATVNGLLPCRAAIRAIDLSNYRYRLDRVNGDIKLIIANTDTYVIWGLTPTHESDIEPPAMWKLDVLNRLHETGRLTGRREPLDLRRDDLVQTDTHG